MGNQLTKYETDLLTDLTNSNYAAQYVASALEDEASDEEFLLAVRDVAEARTMSKVAEDAKLNRVTLYKILRESGNPRLNSLRAVLKALGLRLTVTVSNNTEEQNTPSVVRPKIKKKVMAATPHAAPSAGSRQNPRERRGRSPRG